MNDLKPLIDWKTYRNYEKLRLKRPDIPYYKWRKIYKNAVEFETIFDNYIGSHVQRSTNL